MNGISVRGLMKHISMGMDVGSFLESILINLSLGNTWQLAPLITSPRWTEVWWFMLRGEKEVNREREREREGFEKRNVQRDVECGEEGGKDRERKLKR